MSDLEVTEANCRHRIGVWGDGSCAELARFDHCHNCPVYERLGRRLLERSAPSDYLEESIRWQDAALAQEQRGATESRSVTVFRMGTEWFALPTIEIREILQPLPVHSVPHRNALAFDGMVNFRGELVPCVDLAVLMKLESRTSTNSRHWPRMLALADSTGTWVVPIDEVDGIHRIDHDEFKPPPPTVELGDSRFTESIFILAERQVGLLEGDLVRHAFALAVGGMR